MSKSRKKQKPPKRVLTLPDLEQANPLFSTLSHPGAGNERTITRALKQ